MKSMVKLCLGMFLFVSMNVLAQDDMSNLRSTLQQINDKWGEAMVSGDWNTLMTFYTDDALSMPPNMPIRRGKDEILAENKKDMQAGMKFVEFKGTTNNVFGKDDLVVEEGAYNITYTVPNMTEQMKDQGKYINVWQKQTDGSWKLKAEIWNSDVNPESMNQAGAKEKDKIDDKDFDKGKK